MSIPPKEGERHGVMRDMEDIIRAHDVIEALLSGELPRVLATEEDKRALNLSLQVLCWVLGHDRGRFFERNIEELRQAVNCAGYTEERKC